MKKSIKITIIASISVLLVLAVLTIIIFTQPSKTKLAFYNIPENHEEAIINTIKKSIGDDFEIVNLDSSIPLSNQTSKLKKVSMIFTISDSDNLEFARTNKIVKAFPEELASNMPYTIVNSIQKKEKGLSYLPFLYDMYQIDVNFPHFQKTSLSNINTWDDLLQVASEEKNFTGSPIIFSGADDKELLNIFGQLIELLCTYEEYQQFYDDLYQSYKTNTALDFVQTKLKDDYNIKNVYSVFSQMITNNQIFKSSLNFTQEDTLSYAKNELAGMIFSKLSDHRKISREVIGHYRTIYFPSLLMDDSRKFCTNEYSMILLTDNDTTKKLANDISINLQSEICALTGLAPVQKDAITPDRQSDDVRYWLAASSGPLHPLSSAIPDSQTQKIIANLLR